MPGAEGVVWADPGWDSMYKYYVNWYWLSRVPKGPKGSSLIVLVREKCTNGGGEETDEAINLCPHLRRQQSQALQAI